MPAIRTAAASAAFLVITAGNTIAQSTTVAAPGKPIPLLRILTLPDKTKISPHAHRLGRTAWKTRIAAAHQRPRHPAAPVGAADIRPAPETIAARQIAAAELEQDPAAVTADPAPSELVVAGRAVRVVSPDDANEIDLAADAPEVAASKGPRSDVAAEAPAAQPAAETAVVAQAQEPSPVGTSAWVAQVLAAIGGAMAAGSVAWFLIGSAPPRRYE
jgi:hypothetical protein